MTAPWVRGHCEFSKGRRHRYTLSRSLADVSLFESRPKRVLFLMLNPSTANETANDPTVERCCRFGLRWGYDMLAVANLFSFRSTDPRVLRSTPDAEGDPENAETIVRLAKSAHLVIAAWGVHGALRGRASFVANLLEREGVELHHLGLTKDGHPRHPLYLRGDTVPDLWTPGAKPKTFLNVIDKARATMELDA